MQGTQHGVRDHNTSSRGSRIPRQRSSAPAAVQGKDKQRMDQKEAAGNQGAVHEHPSGEWEEARKVAREQKMIKKQPVGTG